MTEATEVTDQSAKVPSKRPVMLADAVQIAQLLTLVIGLIVVSANMGAKSEKLAAHDTSIKELSTVVSDLTKISIGLSKDRENDSKTVGDAIHKYEQLEERIRTLEQSRPTTPPR